MNGKKADPEKSRNKKNFIFSQFRFFFFFFFLTELTFVLIYHCCLFAFGYLTYFKNESRKSCYSSLVAIRLQLIVYWCQNPFVSFMHLFGGNRS